MNLTKFLQLHYLQEACRWLCEQRQSYSTNDSAWFFKCDYKTLFMSIMNTLHDCSYRFEPVKKLTVADDKPFELRKAIKLCNQVLSNLEVSKHPNKTYIGRLKNGFYFLGFFINRQSIIDLAKLTKEKMIQKLCKFYEHPHKDILLHNYITGADMDTWCAQKMKTHKGMVLIPHALSFLRKI